MKTIYQFFLKHLLLLHVGSFGVKMKSILCLGAPIGTLTWCINQLTQWSISNRDYIISVLVCIAVDHVIGTIYHLFKKRDFTLKKNAIGITTKLGLCAAAVILFEIIHHAVQDAPLIYEYLKVVTRLIVILYPAGSAFMNMSALTNGVFPPLGWIKKIKAFNENLDLERIKPSADNI